MDGLLLGALLLDELSIPDSTPSSPNIVSSLRFDMKLNLSGCCCRLRLFTQKWRGIDMGGVREMVGLYFQEAHQQLEILGRSKNISLLFWPRLKPISLRRSSMVRSEVITSLIMLL